MMCPTRVAPLVHTTILSHPDSCRSPLTGSLHPLLPPTIHAHSRLVDHLKLYIRSCHVPPLSLIILTTSVPKHTTWGLGWSGPHSPFLSPVSCHFPLIYCTSASWSLSFLPVSPGCPQSLCTYCFLSPKCSSSRFLHRLILCIVSAKMKHAQSTLFKGPALVAITSPCFAPPIYWLLSDVWY